MAGSESRIIAGRDPTGVPRAVEVTAAGELLVTGGATQYQEDAPSAGGDLGTMMLAVRNDAGGSLVDANGDYAALQVNAAGQLIIAGGAGGTSMADDAAFAPGATQITPMGAMLDDVAPDTVNEGDAGIPRMSANRNLYVQVRDNAGNERGLNVDAAGAIAVTDGGGSLTIDDGGLPLSVDDNGGSLTVDGGVTADMRDGAGVALTSTLVGADQALDVNIVAGAGAGGTSMVDDAVFTPETTAFTPVGGTFDDVAPDSIAEGDAGVVRMSANRNLYTTIRDAAGNERGLNVDVNNRIGVTNPVLAVVGGGAEATAQRVTIANDSTGVLSVDDNGGSLTVDGGVTADIRDGAGVALTSTLVGADQALDVNIVQTVGGAGGTSMVDDAAFTPATTQITPIGAMLDDAAPDSVDEGDAGVVRMSANRNLYTTIRDAAGNERGLNVDANNRIGVTNAVLSVVGGGTEATAQRVTIANDSTGVLTVDDGGASLTVDNPALSVVGGGVEATALRVTIANDSTGLVSVDDGGAALSVDDAGGSLTVDNAVLSVVGGGTEAAAQRVTIANDSTGVLSVDDNAGSLTVDNPVLSVVGGGAEATAQRVTIANDSTGVLSVDDGGGTLTVDGTVTASNTAGDTAHDAVDAGNPVKIGARAIETDGTDPGEVAEADRTDLKADMNGRLLVNTGHPNAWKTNNNYAAAQTDTALKAAPGANLSLYITSVILSTETAQNIKIVSDTAGGPSTVELGPYYFADNGGMVAMTFEPAIRIAANTNIGVTSSGAVNHTITLNGYIAP